MTESDPQLDAYNRDWRSRWGAFIRKGGGGGGGEKRGTYMSHAGRCN